MAHRRLASARRADKSKRLTRFDIDTDISQDIRAILIMETHILIRDPAARVMKLHSVRSVFDLRFGAHDLKKPRKARRSRRINLHELGQLAHG